MNLVLFNDALVLPLVIVSANLFFKCEHNLKSLQYARRTCFDCTASFAWLAVWPCWLESVAAASWQQRWCERCSVLRPFFPFRVRTSNSTWKGTACDCRLNQSIQDHRNFHKGIEFWPTPFQSIRANSHQSSQTTTEAECSNTEHSEPSPVVCWGRIQLNLVLTRCMLIIHNRLALQAFCDSKNCHTEECVHNLHSSQTFV